LQVFRSARDAQVSKNKFNNISWVRVQCPRQENGIDCGYFVMRFMKEILISKLNEIPKLYIDDFKCVTYSKDKLREIQEEWCQFMLDLK
ncbi:Ulp1 protease family, carboxy-terminal domain protein, partial [Medicago truncatula]